MKPFYLVVETDDPKDEGFAFKSLDYYLEDFTPAFMEEFTSDRPSTWYSSPLP